MLETVGNPTKPRDDCVIQNEAQTHEYQRSSEKGWRRARCEDAWRRDSGLACRLALMHDRKDVNREIEGAREFWRWQLNREFSADGAAVVVRDSGLRWMRRCVLSRDRRAREVNFRARRVGVDLALANKRNVRCVNRM
jgi:hypothetical protein